MCLANAVQDTLGLCVAAQGTDALAQGSSLDNRINPGLQGAAPDIGVCDAVQVSHVRDAHNAPYHHCAGKAQHVGQQLTQERRLRRLPHARTLGQGGACTQRAQQNRKGQIQRSTISSLMPCFPPHITDRSSSTADVVSSHRAN